MIYYLSHNPKQLKLHRAYFQNRKQILLRPIRFQEQLLEWQNYHMEDLVYELNYQSTKIAREVADEFTDKPRFVAGSIGPTNRTASMSPDVK